MPSSYQIGKDLEDEVGRLLDAWQVPYERHKRFSTTEGNEITPDFWLRPTQRRGAIVIECKNFGVSAQSKSDSRRRKMQEALHLLIQIRRHCSETRDAKILLVTGENQFLPEELELLKAELNPYFQAFSVRELDNQQHHLR